MFRRVLTWVFVGGGAMILVGLGVVRMRGEFRARAEMAEMVGQEATIIGRIQGDPDTEKIKLGELQVEGEKMRGVIFLSGKFNHKIRRGDRLTIRGKIVEGFGSYAGSVFRPEIVKIERAEPGSLSVRAREKLVASVLRLLPETEASLGIAYLVGEKRELTEETAEMLALVGLTHLVVASGTHLGIIVEVFRKVFGRVSRFAGLLFSVVFIFLFGMMIGWTASILRAAVVTIISLLAWYEGRKVEAWRVIFMSAVVTLMMNPMFLFDLGWELSFAAFFGIMVLAPEITEFFYGPERPWLPPAERKKQEPGAVTKIIISSFAATAMCAPILVYYFGSLSIISILANVLILPTMPVAMGLTLATGVVGFLPSGGFGIVQGFIAEITRVVLDFHLAVMKFCAEQTEFIMEFPTKDERVFLLYFPLLVMVFVGSFVRAKKRRKATEIIQKNPGKYLRWSRPVKRTGAPASLERKLPLENQREYLKVGSDEV